MTLGYGRISTRAQAPDRQEDMLRARGCERVFMEVASGTKGERPELARLMDCARPGDTLIVESWSRLGRSTKDLIELTEWFRLRGVKVLSLKENFDTETPQGKMMMTIFQAFAQFERDLIAQRTREGLESARARGRMGGRPPKRQKDIELALKLYDSRLHSAAEIARLSGVSQSTLYRYLAKRRSPQK
jgi:DNA invertase Pin-like site-specific DNA recombinase